MLSDARLFGYRVSLYVDRKWQIEKNGCTFYEYKPDDEKILVGSNPFPEEPEQNEIMIKELVYLPNAISVHSENPEEGRTSALTMRINDIVAEDS